MFYKIGNLYYTEKLRILSEIQDELIENYEDYYSNGELDVSWIKFFFKKNNLSFDHFQEKMEPKRIKVQTVKKYLDSLKSL